MRSFALSLLPYAMIVILLGVIAVAHRADLASAQRTCGEPLNFIIGDHLYLTDETQGIVMIGAGDDWVKMYPYGPIVFHGSTEGIVRGFKAAIEGVRARQMERGQGS